MIGTSPNPHLLWMSQVSRWRSESCTPSTFPLPCLPTSRHNPYGARAVVVVVPLGSCFCENSCRGSFFFLESDSFVLIHLIKHVGHFTDRSS